MPGFPALPLPLAIWLAAAPLPDAPRPVAPLAELPGGNSAGFRARMMDWAGAGTPPPALPVRKTIRTPAATPLPRLSSGFGWRSDPIRRTGAMHSGIDIPGPTGAPVLASAAGTVRRAEQVGGYGNLVEIDHGGGLTTRYAHLSRILVRPGTPVAQGETIALIGSTGRSTGSHLHFEVRRAGRAADPLGYLGDAPVIETRWSPLALAPAEPHLSAYARARAAQAEASR